MNWSRCARLILLVCLVTPLKHLHAQFTNEVAIIKDGVRFFVRPSVTVNTTGVGVVQVRLTQIHARIDESYGVMVDGVREPYTAWTRGLVSYFTAIRVNSLSLTIFFDGVQGCTGRASSGLWREGALETASCNEGSRARVTDYSASGLTASGILELQSEVRRRRAADRREAEERARLARADSIARAAEAAEAARRAEAQRAADQAAKAAATRAATASVAQPKASATASAGGSGVAGTTASAGAAASGTGTQQTAAERAAAERDQAAREQARRETEAAQRQLDALRAETAVRQQNLERNMDALAGSVAQVAGLIAENNRRKKEAEARQAARQQAEWEVRIARERAENLVASLARFAEHPVGFACTPSSSRPLRVGERVSDSLSLVTSCRLPSEVLVARYVLTVDKAQHLRIPMEITGPYSGVNFTIVRDGRSLPVESDFVYGKSIRVTPGTYEIQLTTTAKGEVGTYTLATERWLRSKAGIGRWHLAVSYDLANSTVGEQSQIAGNLAFRGGVRIVGGLAAVAEFAMVGAGGAPWDGEQDLSIIQQYGFRFGVGSRWLPIRPYVQWTTGPVLPFDDSDDFTGTSSRTIVGAEWFTRTGGGNLGLEWGVVFETGDLTTDRGEFYTRNRTGLIFGLNTYF